MAKERAQKREPRSAQVPGQFYGYSLQITRAVANLLRAGEGKSVAVEHLADVATLGPGTATLEEDKSGLAHNPIADNSVDLWKSLHNWVEDIRRGVSVRDTRFVLYVAQAHEGPLASRISGVVTREAAAKLLEEIRDQFWGPRPEMPKRATIADGLAPYVNRVLDSDDEVLAELFVNISVERGSGSPNDDLRPELRKLLLEGPEIEQVLQHLLGWTKRAIDKCIEGRRPAILQGDDFRKQLRAAVNAYSRSPNVLMPTRTEITRSDIEVELRDRTYVRQLEAIRLGDDELMSAVRDYLRAAASRSDWSMRGDVVEASFSDFEESLIRAWRGQGKRVALEARERSDEERGLLLHANCILLQLKLQGMDLPGYFVPGSFHSLADTIAIWWHPRFRELMRTEVASIAAADAGSGPSSQPDRP